MAEHDTLLIFFEAAKPGVNVALSEDEHISLKQNTTGFGNDAVLGTNGSNALVFVLKILRLTLGREFIDVQIMVI